MPHIRQALEDTLHMLEDRHHWNLDRTYTPISTGLTRLDEVSGGLGGRSWLLRGGPGTGGTAMALHLARAVASEGSIPVLFVSSDRPPIEICARLITASTRIDLPRLLRADLTDGEWAAIAETVEVLSALQVHVVDARGADEDAVRRLVWTERSLLNGRICLVLDSVDRITSVPAAAFCGELRNYSDLAVVVDRAERGAPPPDWFVAELMGTTVPGEMLLRVLSEPPRPHAADGAIPEVLLHVDRRRLTVAEVS